MSRRYPVSRVTGAHAARPAVEAAVEVWRRDEAPVGFRWRGRHYVVRDVLAHWVEAGGWWLSSTGPTAPAGPDGPVGLDDREREFWRLAAGPDGAPAATGTGSYDLCFDWSTGAWSVVRAHD